MTDTAVSISPRPVVDEDEVHLYCCRDENLALCGADLTGDYIAGADEYPTSCVVCLDLEQTAFCPLVGLCEECDSE